jgi:hypothetical protein
VSCLTYLCCEIEDDKSFQLVLHGQRSLFGCMTSDLCYYEENGRLWSREEYAVVMVIDCARTNLRKCGQGRHHVRLACTQIPGKSNGPTERASLPCSSRLRDENPLCAGLRDLATPLNREQTDRAEAEIACAE